MKKVNKKTNDKVATISKKSRGNRVITNKSNKEKPIYSAEHKKYLKKIHLTNASIVLLQITILLVFLLTWELFADNGIIDSYLFSSPSRIWDTLKTLYKSGELVKHSIITLKETLSAFCIATGIGFLVAIILWHNQFVRRVLEPYIVVLNSLPKIALGPIIIVWMGAGNKAIVTMGILIVVIVTILNILTAFLNTDKNLVSLCQALGANKVQIFFKVILPSAFPDIISTLKINVGLSWIGAIMGEYLVSKAGLGYLLIYGGQVFNLNLVMTSTLVLCFLATIMYFGVAIIEKIVKSHR